jgi:hypothetical protein
LQKHTAVAVFMIIEKKAMSRILQKFLRAQELWRNEGGIGGGLNSEEAAGTPAESR